MIHLYTHNNKTFSKNVYLYLHFETLVESTDFIALHRREEISNKTLLLNAIYAPPAVYKNEVFPDSVPADQMNLETPLF